jgi:hypothetical protein
VARGRRRGSHCFGTREAQRFAETGQSHGMAKLALLDRESPLILQQLVLALQ